MVDNQRWLSRLPIIGRGTMHADDSAFIFADVPPATQAQYERLTVQVRRGKIVLWAGSIMIFIALTLATFRGAAGFRSWLILPVALLLAAVFHLIDERLSSRPPGAIEVPLDLADLLLNVQEVYEEIAEYAAETMTQFDYEQVVGPARENVDASVAAAADVLVAERGGDFATAAALRENIQMASDALLTAHQLLLPVEDAGYDDVVEEPYNNNGNDFNLAPDSYGAR